MRQVRRGTSLGGGASEQSTARVGLIFKPHSRLKKIWWVPDRLELSTNGLRDDSKPTCEPDQQGLRDARRLAYCTYGSPERPVLVRHDASLEGE